MVVWASAREISHNSAGHIIPPVFIFADRDTQLR